MSLEDVAGIVAYVEKLQASGGRAELSGLLPEGICAGSLGKAKRVSKPWGFELWLAHEAGLPYALKMIHIRKGTKTSLQYHKKKAEHNVVFAGELKLHFQDGKSGEIRTGVFSAGSIIQVSPPAVHRVEALTDVFLIEVSSNHLDDVVRVEDDYRRPDGKIETEHVS